MWLFDVIPFLLTVGFGFGVAWASLRFLGRSPHKHEWHAVAVDHFKSERGRKIHGTRFTVSSDVLYRCSFDPEHTKVKEFGGKWSLDVFQGERKTEVPSSFHQAWDDEGTFK
jgi:hypothetical protein